MIKRIPGAVALLMFVAMSASVLAQNSAEPAESEAQSQGSERRGPPIYPMLAAGLIEMGVQVIDLRSEAEVEETGTLAGATNIPHTEIDAIAEFIGDNTSRAVVMYCASGRRVGIAVDALRERGYHGMVNAGGFEDLQQALDGGDEG